MRCLAPAHYSMALQFECQITPAEQSERRLGEPGTDPSLEQGGGPPRYLSLVVFRDSDAGMAVALVPTEIRSAGLDHVEEQARQDGERSRSRGGVRSVICIDGCVGPGR
jgi:hypothetical protein